jgi:FSR family fosmidomycin resistance protein-like MFS transporter
MQSRKVFLIGGLHFFMDLYAGFFGIYMVLADLDPIKAALIISATSFLSNGSQPFLGYWSDRIRGKLPVFLSVSAAALFMSSIGLTTDYRILFVLVLFGLLGVSLFHPAGSNISGAAGLNRKERSFSIFVTIGTFGFAFSHPVFSAFTGRFGLSASPVLALLGLTLALLYLRFSRMEIAGPKKKINLREMGQIMGKRFGTILVLFIITALRHGFIMSLSFFIAKIFSDWGYSRIAFSSANTFYTFAGALGMFTAGQIAHRVKGKSILVFSLSSFLLPFALMILFGQSGQLVPALLTLAATGFIVNLSHVAVVIMGHRILPEGTSTISGILMGFSWAVGRLVYPLVPVFSDFFSWAPGLPSGLILLAVLPLVAAALSLFLPSAVEASADREA